MAENAPSFLGKGWQFPPAFGAGGGEVAMAADEQDIQQSLQILLATAQGERVMREDFGCDLRRFAFETMDRGLAGQVAAFVKTALLRYEPRIAVEAVEAESSSQSEGVLLVQVVYRVLATNSRYNLVYPFYLQEGARPLP